MAYVSDYLTDYTNDEFITRHNVVSVLEGMLEQGNFTSRFLYDFICEYWSLIENGYDVLPVTIAAIEDSYEERSAVIYISADGKGDVSDVVQRIIDDNPNKWNRYIDGVPVVGNRDDIMKAVKIKEKFSK